MSQYNKHEEKRRLNIIRKRVKIFWRGRKHDCSSDNHSGLGDEVATYQKFNDQADIKVNNNITVDNDE